LLDFIVDRIGFGLLRHDHRGDVLDEIDPAFFAIAAGALLVAACRTFVAHRVVAALAETRNFAHRGAALWTLHRGLLRRRHR